MIETVRCNGCWCRLDKEDAHPVDIDDSHRVYYCPVCIGAHEKEQEE